MEEDEEESKSDATIDGGYAVRQKKSKKIMRKKFLQSKEEPRTGVDLLGLNLYIPDTPWDLLMRHAFVKSFERAILSLDTESMQNFQRTALQKELAAASPEEIAKLAWDWCQKNAAGGYMVALMEKQHK